MRANISIGDFLADKLKDYSFSPKIYEYGTVVSVSDGVVSVDGLPNCKYDELLKFGDDEYGIALDLDEKEIKCVMLSKSAKVVPGDRVSHTGTVAQIGVSEELFGRIIDPIGRVIDGGEEIKRSKPCPLESPAPRIMDRSEVNTPLMTGVLAVDSMIPIGRGQRELIIGDRQTGKTTIALTAMINQTKGDVICVYCAIGQKASTVADVANKLKKAGKLDNTVIVATTSDDCAAMQYLTPYAGCAIAEHFMAQGRDVLVVYDDLSKHAVAYRTMSLLLRRPSGREAYPGDVFYLHSRLLERAAKMNEAKGGGSITAMPIIETMAGDISAYIPTNVISITDGQIYLESDLFNSGVRPAVNVGLSVSRVGRHAQSQAMKEVSGNLRLELAQYRDTAVFAQFGADIDDSTAKQLSEGERLTELLKQGRDRAFSLAEQTAILTAQKCGAFSSVPTKRVEQARDEFLVYMNKNHTAQMLAINTQGTLDQTTKETVEKEAKSFLSQYEN